MDTEAKSNIVLVMIGMICLYVSTTDHCWEQWYYIHTVRELQQQPIILNSIVTTRPRVWI
jgi:hypothetical protein